MDIGSRQREEEQEKNPIERWHWRWWMDWKGGGCEKWSISRGDKLEKAVVDQKVRSWVSLLIYSILIDR
jgi:hypothetical protein